MNNEFDLFAKSDEVVDDLSAELEKATYKWTNKFTTVLMSLLLVAVGASGGVWYAHQTTPTTNGFAIGSATGANANFAGRIGRNGGGAGGLATPAAPGTSGTTGTITKINGTTITIQSRDGKSVEIKAAADTPVLSTSRQDIAALKVGDRLTATGETAADGSITPIALTQGGGFGGGQGRGGTGNAAVSPQGTSNGTQANQSPITSNKNGKQKGVTKNKNGKSVTPQSSAPEVSGAPGAGPGPGGPGGPGGGNGELRKCLSDAGIEFAPGSRPDLTDPTIAAAFEKCRAQFPGGGGQGGQGGGPGGGGQGGQRGGQGGGAPSAPAAN